MPSDVSPRSIEEEERRVLAELRRQFRIEMWASRADGFVRPLLAQGMANLLLLGYTREQRQALQAWGRVERRKSLTPARTSVRRGGG